MTVHSWIGTLLNTHKYDSSLLDSLQ